tara:strand:+ start:60 stop:230 length:171 start_codon:yes stop_codon:yes gene_type:complete
MEQNPFYFYLIFSGALIVVFIGASALLVLFSLIDWGRSQIDKRDIEKYENVNTVFK